MPERGGGGVALRLGLGDGVVGAGEVSRLGQRLEPLVDDRQHHGAARHGWVRAKVPERGGGGCGAVPCLPEALVPAQILHQEYRPVSEPVAPRGDECRESTWRRHHAEECPKRRQVGLDDGDLPPEGLEGDGKPSRQRAERDVALVRRSCVPAPAYHLVRPVRSLIREDTHERVGDGSVFHYGVDPPVGDDVSGGDIRCGLLVNREQRHLHGGAGRLHHHLERGGAANRVDAQPRLSPDHPSAGRLVRLAVRVPRVQDRHDHTLRDIARDVRGDPSVFRVARDGGGVDEDELAGDDVGVFLVRHGEAAPLQPGRAVEEPRAEADECRTDVAEYDSHRVRVHP